MRTVALLLHDEVRIFDHAVVYEVFERAPFTLRRCAPGRRPVRLPGGVTVRPDAGLDALPAADLVIVPGTETPEAPVGPAIVRALRSAHDAGVPVAALCAGAFTLAGAGLLDGRRATTHWAYCATLARHHPAVAVDPSPIYVRDGHIATSAGVTSGIDLALALVEEDLGRDIALAIARRLVLFLRRPGSQSQFSAQLAAQVAERDGLRHVQRWVAEHPGDDLSVARLAQRAGMSVRHFARSFREEIGVTPARYVEQARLEAARRLLEESDDGVESVARRCGFGTSETMRRTFLRALHLSPAEYRRRFQAAS